MVAAQDQSLPPLQPNRGRAGWIPESVRLTIRSFYVLQGLGPTAIAPMVRMSPLQVQNLIAREGWAKLKAIKQRERSVKAIALQDARASADVQRVVEAVAIRSEELSVRTLDYCGELLDAKDAKSLQMASGAARNFVTIARASRGLDNPRDRGSSEGGSPNVLVFVTNLERVAPRDAVAMAKPVIELAPSVAPLPALLGQGSAPA